MGKKPVHPGTGMEIPVNDILDSIQDAVVMLDTDRRVTYVNRAAAQFAGRPAEELLGKSTWDIFPNAPGNVFYNELHRAVSDFRQGHFEEYCPSVDRWPEAEVHRRRRHGSDCRDITSARRQARDSEERLRLALSFGKMGFWEWYREDPDGSMVAGTGGAARGWAPVASTADTSRRWR